ncbi:Uncharacterised protein [Legionella beliardensis]|uniref:Uncharacterized protein n=1 Tax=Legionella beliardensis TaxID=91822 RepID=A0A378I050_9GAMM|nr:hypothetical protein [Legionella beliardensis]STX27946.1 Uncharacterised protein [Legionella beliardensis]
MTIINLYDFSYTIILMQKPCPLNQDLQVINIIPNYDLRSEIFTYIEAQEENFAKKQKLAI